MSFLSPKSFVERLEEGFNTKRMENREVYHELNIRGGDPELLRTQVLELVEDLGYDVLINKFTKFENDEFKSLFDAGRLKPLRAVLNAEKRVETGSMFPNLWKIMLMIGVIVSAVYFVPQDFLDNIGFTIMREFFAITGVFLLFITFVLWYTRRVDVISIWFKASGIYNVEDKSSDFKIILSGETTTTNERVNSKLNEEITEIFRVVSKKYVKEKEPAKKAIIEISSKSKNVDVDVIKGINKADSDLRNLDSRLANGEITEKVFNEVRENLLDRKRKLETILDLINV